MREGKRVVKLCDFGSARSGYSWHGPGTEPTKNHASLDLEMTDMGGACKGCVCVMCAAHTWQARAPVLAC
eukprot:scaffold210724_cov22-Tisochrysis_lutea.AAC.1